MTPMGCAGISVDGALTVSKVSSGANHFSPKLTVKVESRVWRNSWAGSAAKPASRIRSGNLDQDGVSSRTEIFSDAVIQASMTALAALARFPSTQNTQQKIVGSLINDVKMGLTSHAETRSRITIG